MRMMMLAETAAAWKSSRVFSCFDLRQFWVVLLILAILCPVGEAAESGTPHGQVAEREKAGNAVDSGQFLQHFLSRSLVAESASSSSLDVRQVGDKEGIATAPVAPGNLTAAATKMILALGGILLVLIAGAYGVRHYVLHQTVFSTRNAQLRVVSKVPLTTKTAVALVEVPGKLVVIGIAGNTLTALSEVPHDAVAQTANLEEAATFTTALEQQTQALEEPREADEALWHVAETIQRKVRGLKRL